MDNGIWTVTTNDEQLREREIIMDAAINIYDRLRSKLKYAKRENLMRMAVSDARELWAEVLKQEEAR